MTALYKIADEYQFLMRALIDVDEITDEQWSMLSKIDADIENKAINTAYIIENMVAEQEAVEKAYREMHERSSRLKKKIESLTQYLKTNLELCGIQQVNKSPHFVIKIKKCPVSVNVENEKEVAEKYREYTKIKEIISLDKTKMKIDLENGVYIQGAELKQNTRLEIK